MSNKGVKMKTVLQNVAMGFYVFLLLWWLQQTSGNGKFTSSVLKEGKHQFSNCNCDFLISNYTFVAHIDLFQLPVLSILSWTREMDHYMGKIVVILHLFGVSGYQWKANWPNRLNMLEEDTI